MDSQENDNKESMMKSIGASFRSKGFRSGAYMTLITALVIVVVVAVNLIVSVLDVKKDLTADNKFSITEETKTLLSDLNDDIQVYYLTKNDEKISWITTILEAMQKESKKISVKTIDTIVNPRFTSSYTAEEVSQHSIIVENERTGIFKYIPYADMLLTEMGIDPTTYQYTQNITGVDIEGQIYSALKYCTSGTTRKLYAELSRGELELGEEGKARLRKANIEYAKLSITTTAEIPEDCDILMISNPTTDFTETELEVIRAYVQKGGNLLINSVHRAELVNFSKLLADYGVTIPDGVVVEGDSSHHLPNVSYSLIPVIGTVHMITKDIPDSKIIVLPMSYSTVVSDTLPENLTATTLLSTTESAFLKLPNSQGVIDNLTKLNTDKGGPFRTGVHVVNSATGSEAVIFGCGHLFIDNCLAASGYGNSDLLTNTVNVLSKQETTATIRSILFDDEEMLTITAAEANAIAIVFAAVIPIFLIIMGVAVMASRKKR